MFITCLIKCWSESRFWTGINLYVVAIYEFVFLVYFYLNTCNPFSLWLFIRCKFDFMVRFLIIGLCLWFLLGNFLFFVNGILIWVFFTGILKFQRVAHHVFDKLLAWLCMIKLTWVCAASHYVAVSLFALFFLFFIFYMSSWKNLMIETKQWVVGSYSTSWKIFIWLDCALLDIINDI